MERLANNFSSGSVYNGVEIFKDDIVAGLRFLNDVERNLDMMVVDYEMDLAKIKMLSNDELDAFNVFSGIPDPDSLRFEYTRKLLVDALRSSLTSHQRLALESLEHIRKVKKILSISNYTNKLDLVKAKSVLIYDLYKFNKIKSLAHGKYMACCPFHKDDTPSFLINSDNTFKCFSCQEHGDSVNFIMILNNLSFVDAIKYINND